MTQATCINCGQPFQPGQSMQAFLRSPNDPNGSWTAPVEVDVLFQLRFKANPFGNDIKRRHFDNCQWYKVNLMNKEWKNGIPAVGERVAFNRLDRFELDGCPILRNWEDGEELEVISLQSNSDGRLDIPVVWNHRTHTGQGINPDLLRPLETPAERRYKSRVQQILDDSMTLLPGHDDVKYSLTFAQAEALVAKGWVKAIPLSNEAVDKLSIIHRMAGETRKFAASIESVVRGEKEL